MSTTVDFSGGYPGTSNYKELTRTAVSGFGLKEGSGAAMCRSINGIVNLNCSDGTQGLDIFRMIRGRPSYSVDMDEACDLLPKEDRKWDRFRTPNKNSIFYEEEITLLLPREE